MAATQQSNVEIAEELYDAFNRGDLAECLAGFADDVVWTAPAGSPIASGTFNGPDEVMENVFARVPELFDSFEVAIDRLIDGDDTVVMEGALKGTTHGGESIEVPVVHVSDYQDGKLQQFAEYTDTALLEEALEA